MLLFLEVLVFALAAFLQTSAGDVHFNRITDEVGVFLYDGFQAILVQIFVVVIIFGIRFNGKNNLCSDFIFARRGNCVPVCAIGFPLVSCVAAKCFTCYGDVVCDHECGIEAYPELTDDVVTVFRFVLFLKSKRSTLRDNPEVVLKLILRHPDTCIADR
ncbi:hypothetical protein D3C86_1770490 [compost metagenome]